MSKILHVAAVEFTTTRLLLPQLTHLKDAGHEVTVACTPSGDEFSDPLLPFNPQRLGFPRSLDPAAMATATADLRRIVGRIRPDLVHFHSPAAALPGRIAFTLPNSPIVAYTVHGYLHQWGDRSPKARFLEFTERQLSRITDMSLFQSREDYDQAKARGYGSMLRYLGNGVQERWFTGPRTEFRPDGMTRFGYVGRLSEEKGVVDMLRAFSGVKNASLVMVGAALDSDRDDATPRIRTLVESTALAGRVELTGMVPPEAVADHLADVDVFILPSWREGVPRSLIEAMATGLPAITTNIRGCSELVDHGEHGWIVPAKSPDALRRAMRQATEASDGELARRSKAAFDRVDTGYRERFVFERLVAAYAELGL